MSYETLGYPPPTQQQEVTPDLLPLTPNQTRQITDPLERQRVALAHLEAAREEWKQQAARWSAVRAEAVAELKTGRTWAQVAELLGVSEATAWNIAHQVRYSRNSERGEP